MQAKYIVKLVLISLIALPLPAQDKKEHVFFDKTNMALFSADALVRSLDAQSTRSFMTNPCKCIREAYLPNYIVSSTPRMYAYSLGVSAGLVGMAYLAHKTHHHKLERLIPAMDIAYDGRLVLGNYHNISTANRMYSSPAASDEVEYHHPNRSVIK